MILGNDFWLNDFWLLVIAIVLVSSLLYVYLWHPKAWCFIALYKPAKVSPRTRWLIMLFIPVLALLAYYLARLL